MIGYLKYCLNDRLIRYPIEDSLLVEGKIQELIDNKVVALPSE